MDSRMMMKTVETSRAANWKSRLVTHSDDPKNHLVSIIILAFAASLFVHTTMRIGNKDRVGVQHFPIIDAFLNQPANTDNQSLLKKAIGFNEHGNINKTNSEVQNKGSTDESG